MKIKKKIAKALILVLVLSIIGLSLTSCSGGDTAVSGTDKETETKKSTSTILTSEQKKEKFEEIIWNIQNSQTVAEAEPYFYGLDESELPDRIDYIKSFRDYSEMMLNLVAETDKSFFIARMDYTVSKENGNTDLSWQQNQYVVSLIDKDWKLDFSTDEDSEIIKLVNEKYESKLLSGAFDFSNFVVKNGLYHFFIANDEKKCFKDIVRAYLLCAYQDNEGNIYAEVLLNNGNMAGKEIFNDFSLDITDEKLGTIVNTAIQFNETVPAQTAKNVTLFIPKEEVYTGVQSWGNVSWTLNYKTPSYNSSSNNSNYQNNNTPQYTVCPICNGTGVVQQVIGMDANGIPQYGMVGCGGCGGSGYIYQ